MTVTAATPPESGFEPEIRTAAGVLRGRLEAGLAVFRGIPYAEPPVGALRFAAPQAVSAWTGVRPAFSFGPPPPQPGIRAGRLRAGDPRATTGSRSTSGRPIPLPAPGCR